MEELAFPVVGIVGETASGKTAFSIALAKALGGPDHAEIISADAMQLYRGMDIGTAKATSDERGGIFHRQIDVLDVADEASVAAYQRESRADIRDITSKGKVALVVGGSGLYISAALDELDFPGTDPSLRRALEQRVANEGLGSLIDELTQKDPVSARTIDIHNPRRVIRALEVVCLTGRSYTPVFPPHTSHFTPTLMLGVRRERDVLNEAISQRAAAMFEHGLLKRRLRFLSMAWLTQQQRRKRLAMLRRSTSLRGGSACKMPSSLSLRPPGGSLKNNVPGSSVTNESRGSMSRALMETPLRSVLSTTLACRHRSFVRFKRAP